MVAVTGATGHLGTVLVRELVSRGEEVRYVTRSGVPRGLENSPATPYTAGLFDSQAMVRAFDGARTVYHSAARISLMPGDAAELNRVNVEGTRSVLTAARQAGVDRFVHVGSIEAFPLEYGPSPMDESAGFDPDRTIMEYGRSKALSMSVVLEESGNGMDCVVCCPTALVGPPDYRRSLLGQVVYDVIRRRLPAMVNGGFDFADVRDVAAGLIRAAEVGQSGRVYLLSGRYATVDQLVKMAAEAGNVRPPALCLPPGVLMPVMPVVEAYYRLSRRSPRFTRSSIRLLSLEVQVDCSRARTELGYTCRPLEETITDTVRWLEQHGES